MRSTFSFRLRIISASALYPGNRFCSPITLFAVLAVIRQAVDNFALEQTSNEILRLLGSFDKQWRMFVDKMDILGTRINAAQKEFDILTSTRKRQLEKPLSEIENLRTQRKLEIESEKFGNEPE